METNSKYYLDKLRADFSDRQRKNSRFSLRAYSQFLGVHPSALSLILKGKRDLPLKVASAVCEKLELSPAEEKLFIESIYRKKVSLADIKLPKMETPKVVLDESHHKVISEWEHYAFLSLMKTKSFSSDHAAIAERLGVTTNRVRVVTNHLKQIGLIDVDAEGNYIRLTGNLETTEDVISRAIRKSHKETLEMGKAKLEEVEVTKRDFSTLRFPANPEKMGVAKEIIREFQDKLAALMMDQGADEVYQCAVQLYPLTKEMNKEQEKLN